MKAFLLIIMSLSLQLLAPAAALAQSWSAWKQLAEEQEKNAQLAQAENSWRAAYQMIKQKGAKDSRLYISSLKLAKVLVREKQSDEAEKILTEVCGSDIAIAGAADEKLACLQMNRDFCKERQDTVEARRVDALIEKISEAANAVTTPNTQASLLFGEAAKDDLYKKLGRVRQFIKQKDFSSAEQELNAAQAIASATHGHDVMCLVLREQGKLFCITKDYKKAEIAYKNLSEIVKQDAGPESLNYVEVLGSHARLLQLLGDEKQAAIEQAKCEIISNKFKITPTDQQELANSFQSGPDSSSWSNNSGAGIGANRLFGNGNARANNANHYPPGTRVANATAGNTAPKISGRLKVIEFYTVW